MAKGNEMLWKKRVVELIFDESEADALLDAIQALVAGVPLAHMSQDAEILIRELLELAKRRSNE
jgi:hypothetical protein